MAHIFSRFRKCQNPWCTTGFSYLTWLLPNSQTSSTLKTFKSSSRLSLTFEVLSLTNRVPVSIGNLSPPSPQLLNSYICAISERSIAALCGPFHTSFFFLFGLIQISRFDDVCLPVCRHRARFEAVEVREKNQHLLFPWILLESWARTAGTGALFGVLRTSS